jgi:prepilin-type N-terminal cleavage/methylation domain-containing protein
MGKSAKGFSLLELLIVVAIILIIATIAIPNILTSLKATKETAAVSSLKAINAAQILYLSTSGGNYGTIPDLVNSKAIDSRFAETMNGYDFTITASTGEYTAQASPATSSSGRYAFYSNADGVIRYSTAVSLAPAGQAGAPVH